MREGIRRIGEVVREQVGLYGTLTGAAPSDGERRRSTAEGAAAAPAVPAPDAELAKVLQLPRKRAG